MATDTLKSLTITNLDASPPVRGTGGQTAAGLLKVANGYVTPTTGVLTGSTYRMVRIPSGATIKAIWSDYVGTITTFTGDVTIYYSDETLDQVGASYANSGVVNSLSTTAALFAHTYVWGSATAGVPVDITNQNATTYTPIMRTQPLWQAAGLTSDPGGYFDITIYETSTVSCSGATIVFTVYYTEPYV